MAIYIASESGECAMPWHQSGETYSDLLEVEEVLERRHFAEEDAMRDRVRSQERRGEVVGVTGFSRMRPEPKCI